MQPRDGQAWVGLVPGVWFFSLDATNPAAVAAARLAYGLPYFPADMSVEKVGDHITYESQRRGEGPDRPGHRIVVAPGAPLPPDRTTEFDHFLTARFRLWTVNRGVVLESPAEHPTWPLRAAEVRRLDQDLLQRAGLRPPSGTPVVHYSDGVDVRIGRPSLVRRVGSA